MIARRYLSRWVLCLSLLAAITLASLSPFGAEAADNPSQTCQDNFDFFLGSHGACVSLLASGNLTASIAELCRDPQVQMDALLIGAPRANHGQCVKAWTSIIGGEK